MAIGHVDGRSGPLLYQSALLTLLYKKNKNKKKASVVLSQEDDQSLPTRRDAAHVEGYASISTLR